MIQVRALQRSHLLAGLVFCGLWFLCSWPWLSGNVTIPYDAKALYQAQLQFLANALHSGQSPAWNPHIFVGLPQIADPQSLIFSPAWLIAWWSEAPSFWSLDAYVFALKALAGGSVLMLFRGHGWHAGAGLLAAVAFAFGGSAAWRIQHIGQIQSYAFFALALWLTVRATRRAGLIDGAAAGVAIGLLIVSRDQVAMLGCYLLAIIVIAGWLTAAFPLQALRRQLPALLAAGVVALVIAILPVAFTWAFLSGSNRPSIDIIEAHRASLHPASLLSLFIADLFSAANPAAEYWGPYSDPWNPDDLALSPNMCQLYLGALPILLVVMAMFRGQLWRRDVLAYAIAGLFCLVYALGAFTPGFSVIYGLVPGVAFFRRPADATFLLGGMMSILAGYAAHCWLTGESLLERDRIGRRVGLVVAIMILVALAISIRQGRLGVAILPLGTGLMWLGAAALLLTRRLTKHWRAGRLASLLPAIFLAGDLAINNGPSEATGKPEDATLEALRPAARDETLAFLKAHVRRSPGSAWRDRIEIAGLGFNWQNIGEAQGLDQTLGYNPLRIEVVAKALGAGDYIAGYDQREFSMFFPSYHCQLADMLGLRYIVSPVPVAAVDHQIGASELTLAARTPDAYIYENPGAMARVMFVSEAIHGDFDAILADGRWPRFDPRKAVLLETGAPTSAATRAPASSPFAASTSASVELASYQNTRIDITVDADRPGYVLLNDVWHPWWQATVDGVAVPVLKANLMFRAVAVPAGRHVVRFEFQALAGLASDLRRQWRSAWAGEPSERHVGQRNVLQPLRRGHRAE